MGGRRGGIEKGEGLIRGYIRGLDREEDDRDEYMVEMK